MLMPPRSVAKGGASHGKAENQALAKVERTNESLKLGGRTELAAVPADPDFFQDVPDMGKTRTHAWRAIRDARNLVWVIPTAHPRNINRMLPSDWFNGFHNVCIGAIIRQSDEPEEKIKALLGVRAAYRMLLLDASKGPVSLAGIPGEIGRAHV